MSAPHSQRTPLHVEVNLQIGTLQRDGLTGNALALLNRCYLIIAQQARSIAGVH